MPKSLVTQPIDTTIDPAIYALYDEYCHSSMDRREFFAKASALTLGGLAMAPALFPRHSPAPTISFSHQRLKTPKVQ